MATSNLSMPWVDPKYAVGLDGSKISVLSTKSDEMQNAEWLAHQVNEHYHLLWALVGKVASSQRGQAALCKCPKLSASHNTVWSWSMERGDSTEPRASHYYRLAETWITDQLKRRDIFPIKPRDPSKGREAQEPVMPAPPLGEEEPMAVQIRGEVCRTSFILMSRVYAHLYWGHFNKAFVQIGMEETLNKSYTHFLITGASLDLLKPTDLEPLQAMINVWAREGVFSENSEIYKMLNSPPDATTPNDI